MKIFNRDKYQFDGIYKSPVDGQNYYAFTCIKNDFTPETVLVKEAKIIYDDKHFTYLNESELDQVKENMSSLSLKSILPFSKTLAVNEMNWSNRRVALKM